MARSGCPSCRSRRISDADAIPPDAAPSCRAPVRGRVTAPIPLPRRARQYSMPRILFGSLRSAASVSPSSSAAARSRQTANVSPPASRRCSAARKSSPSRHAATRISAAASPHSEPKATCVTTPVRRSSATPPRAKRSADAMAQTVGSSNTTSAPQRSAISARARFSATAGSPRWTKLLLMTHTTGRL